MKRTNRKGRSVKNTSNNEQKNLTQSAENQDKFLKFLAEIIVEIIIKETVHGSDRIHQKKH